MKKKLTAILSAVLALCLCFAIGCNVEPTEPGPGPEQKPKPTETFDATKLPYYVEDTTTLQYSYTDEERIIPFWQGNVMHNEQLMIVEKNGVTQGKLLYKPTRVISVRDWALNKEYEEGKDYVVDGDTITLPAGSTIPVFKDEWSRGQNIPSEYPQGNAGTGWQFVGDGTVMYTETGLTWQNYIHVTYAYNPADVDRSVLAKYSGILYGLSEKIASSSSEDKHIKMAVFGDSISEGCSSSAKWNHAPMCPPYAELVKYGLEHFGGLDVEFRNMSVGGKDSAWAADKQFDPDHGYQLPKLASFAPDLLILAFGTNDNGNNLSSGAYRKNIETVIEMAKSVNSECQILLVAPFPSHEKSQPASNHQLICTILKAIADETPYMDVGYVSMYEGCLKMLEKKNYYEIAANNVNHPNDFIHRFYAMQILSTVIDFNTVAAK